MLKRILGVITALLMLPCIWIAVSNYGFTSQSAETLDGADAFLSGEGDLLTFSFDAQGDLWHEVKVRQESDHDFMASAYFVEGALELSEGAKMDMGSLEDRILMRKERDRFDYSISRDSDGDETEHYTTNKYRFEPSSNGTYSFVFVLDGYEAELSWTLNVLYVDPEVYDAAESKFALAAFGSFFLFVISLVLLLSGRASY